MPVDVKFLSSLALISSICNKEESTDIYQVISSFVKSTICISQLHIFSIVELNAHIKTIFELEIPDAVLRKAISVLLNNKSISLTKGEYRVIDSASLCNDKSIIETDQNEQIYQDLKQQLFEYIKRKYTGNITAADFQIIEETFNNFILGGYIENSFSTFITAFILKLENSNKDLFNQIKEGLILYNGIRYNQIPNGKAWKNSTIFFLDTEYLFNAVGLNGPLYKQMFFDFYNLVKEINSSTPSDRNGKNIIQIRYFKETKEEISDYFKAADSIKRGKAILNPGKEAMKNIVNGCKNSSDVLRKKSDMFYELGTLGIIEHPSQINITDNPKYILETEELVEKFISDANPLIEKEKYSYLKFCDYLNILRNGIQSKNIESVGYTLLSENSIGRMLSKNISDYYKDNNIGNFICRMDFVTDRLWFKLNKGIGNSTKPISFDIVARSQITFAGILRNEISREYDDYLKDLKDGHLNSERAESLYNELRQREVSPDSINSNNVDESLLYLHSEDKYEKFRKEQDFYKLESKKVPLLEKTVESTQKEIDKIKAELYQYKKKEKRERFNEHNKKKKGKKITLLIYVILNKLIAVLAFLVLFYFLYEFYIKYEDKTEIINLFNILMGIFGLTIIGGSYKAYRQLYFRMKSRICRSLISSL